MPQTFCTKLICSPCSGHTSYTITVTRPIWPSSVPLFPYNVLEAAKGPQLTLQALCALQAQRKSRGECS